MCAGVWPAKPSTASQTRADAPSDAVARESAARRGARLLRRAVLAAVVAAVLVSQRASRLSASDRLGRLSPAWLALALGAEAASCAAAAELQHHLPAATGVRVGGGRAGHRGAL
jgi:hypothetical protein